MRVAQGIFTLEGRSQPNNLVYLIITFDSRDITSAEFIKNRLGGNILIIKGKNAIRYRLNKQEEIIILLNKLNGLIRTSNRIKQFKEACLKYNIEYKSPIPLEFKSAWFSGFFDADGHISYNKNKTYANMNICLAYAHQKYLEIFNDLTLIYGGKVHKHNVVGDKITSYRYCISKRMMFYLY